MLKPSEQCSFFQEDRFEGSHANVFTRHECFPIYLLRNQINVCWNPQNSAHFSKTIDFMGHMPRFTLKMNIFPYISWEIPDMCVETLRTVLDFLRWLLWGVTCLFLVEKWSFYQLCPWKPKKCMLKPSQQGLFFWDNQFKWSHAYVYSKNEHFLIYLLRNPINVCWNPHNRACFAGTIDLRGHMPRFTLKVNIFPSISWETLDKCDETLRT